MESNILELECSEQPISAYQAIGLIDCNISAQGSGTFRKQALLENELMLWELSTQMSRLRSPYYRHFKNRLNKMRPRQAIIFTRKRTVKKTKSSTSGSSENSGQF